MEIATKPPTLSATLAACDLYRMLHESAPPGSAMELPALAAYVEALEARVGELATTVADLIAAGPPMAGQEPEPEGVIRPYRTETCPRCEGTGETRSGLTRVCPKCLGLGTVYTLVPDMAVVPRAMLDRIIDANDEGQEYGSQFWLPNGHWQDITGWAEEALR